MNRPVFDEDEIIVITIPDAQNKGVHAASGAVTSKSGNVIRAAFRSERQSVLGRALARIAGIWRTAANTRRT